MNAGQILETHLGWASKELGKTVGKLIETNNAALIRNRLKEIFGDGDMPSFLEKLTEDELIELANHVKEGVHIAVPVFDSAKEKEISEAFTLAGLPDTRQITLFDGRSGEPFHHKVTIGYMYIWFDEHRGSVGEHFRDTLHHLGSIVTGAHDSVSTHIGGVSKHEVEGFSTGLFAEVGQQTDVAADVFANQRQWCRRWSENAR